VETFKEIGFRLAPAVDQAVGAIVVTYAKEGGVLLFDDFLKCAQRAALRFVTADGLQDVAPMGIAVDGGGDGPLGPTDKTALLTVDFHGEATDKFIVQI